MRLKMQKLSAVFKTVIFLLLVALAFSVRDYHFSREKEKLGFVPFTIESAMMYGYSRDIALNGKLPETDPELAGFENVDISRQMSLSLEYFLGYGCRIYRSLVRERPPSHRYENHPEIPAFMRTQIRLWISLGAGLVFLWLIALRCPWPFALFAGLIYSFSPSAIARATGQDLIRENFAIPLILLSFVLIAWALRRPRSSILLLCSGIAVFLSLASWDMAQLCFGIWALLELGRLFAGGILNAKRRRLFACIFVSASAAGLFVPYLQAHHFLLSPTFFVLLGALFLAAFFLDARSSRKRTYTLLGVVCGLLLLWLSLSALNPYPGHYSHFFRLIAAKIRFLNVKPLNPLLLDYDSRIMWTPALHSATFRMTHYLFPGMLYALPALFALSLFTSRARNALKKSMPLLLIPSGMGFCFFLLYVFMVRFHALASPFLCVSMGVLACGNYKRLRGIASRTVFISLAVVVAASVADISFYLAGRRDYRAEYLPETMGLIYWLRTENTVGETILADFVLSPMLKTYADARIVLQPKFELGETRRRVEEYLKTMYFGTEIDLRDFCERYKVAYFIFDRGYFADLGPGSENSPRYCAGAIEIPQYSPVHRMFADSMKLRYFYRIRPRKPHNFIERKYFVFKVILPEDLRNSRIWTEDAKAALRAGNTFLAKRLVKSAVFADPNSPEARVLYARIYGKSADIRPRGF